MNQAYQKRDSMHRTGIPLDTEYSHFLRILCCDLQRHVGGIHSRNHFVPHGYCTYRRNLRSGRGSHLKRNAAEQCEV